MDDAISVSHICMDQHFKTYQNKCGSVIPIVSQLQVCCTLEIYFRKDLPPTFNIQ